MKAAWILACCVAVSGLSAAQGIITTMAGTGDFGYSGDGGPAVVATLSTAGAVAVDSAGNVYFSDYYRIRRVSPDGLINTIAGTGVYGHSGDGGPALTATISFAEQIAIHGSRLCFTEVGGYKIRCIDLNTGVIQGLGSGNSGTGGDGGDISGASFVAPSGLAFDEAGNLFISDSGANRVRRVDALTGIITLFAGPGPGYCCAPVGDGGPALGANLYGPMGLYSGDGGLYIADTGNFRIRRVDLATGTISTVAGSGSPYDPPGGADGGPALLAGINARRIMLDPSGNLYVDTGTTVREVDRNGIITTIAGTTGTTGYGYDDVPSTEAYFGGTGGIAWDDVAQRLLVSDNGTRVRQIFYTPPTTTSLVSSVNPAVFGSQVTLVATVSPATATGVVRFRQDGALLGSVAISNGTAAFTWTAPVGGSSSHQLRAIYGGDTTHNLSAATIEESVQQGTTTTAMTSTPNPSTAGQSVTFTITVAPAAATGKVFLESGSTTLGNSPLTDGVATISLTNLALGSTSIHARYGGSLAYLGSESATLTQVVRTATTTSLSTSPNPSQAGSPVTLTATVLPAEATGSVKFFRGEGLLGAANLTGGQAQLTVSNLPAGEDSLTAAYGGDAAYGDSTSAVVVQTVSLRVCTVTLSSSVNPSIASQSVLFTARISPDNATGAVGFYDGLTLVGTATVSGGVAELLVSGLSLGMHSMVASYEGDATTESGNSNVVVQTVKTKLVDLTLTSSPNPSKIGQTIILTGMLSASDVPGMVTFFGDNCMLGAVRVSGGSASLSVPPGLCGMAEGSHVLEAVFDSDVPAPGVGSNVVTQVIIPKSPTSVAVSSSANPSVVGQHITITARVSPRAATGVVVFLDGDVEFARALIVNGRASVTTSALSAGSHWIYAGYLGDGDYDTSGADYNQAVSKRHTNVVVDSSRNPATVGQTLTFSATVWPHDATGTVEFYAGTVLLGTTNVSGGSASLTVPPETYAFPAGANTISANFGGDAKSDASTANMIQVMFKAPTSVALTSSLNPAQFGQPVTFTATVSPNTATGRVQFLDGPTTLGFANVSGGSAVLSVSTLAVGWHSITAAYSGDANYTASASARLTETVSPGAPGNLIAVAASSSRIDLSWTASPTSGVTYNVYAAVVPGFTPSPANRIAFGAMATSFSNWGLPPGTTRYYVVTAQRSGIESAPSNQVSATTAER